MILLDTNVVSELMRPAPSAAVENWVSGQPAASMFISAITEAELRYGLALMPDGQRQRRLLAQAEAMLAEDFAGRILPFDSAAASTYARIAVARRLAGRPMSQADAQIAAIAASRGAAIATRNMADFEGCGIVVLDPWAAQERVVHVSPGEFVRVPSGECVGESLEGLQPGASYIFDRHVQINAMLIEEIDHIGPEASE